MPGLGAGLEERVGGRILTLVIGPMLTCYMTETQSMKIIVLY